MKYFVLLIAAALLFTLLGLIGGSTSPLDVTIIRHFMTWRQTNPQGTGAVILFTNFGSGLALLSLTATGAIWLSWRSQRARAVALVGAVIGGRLGIEGIKLLVDRPRPSLDPHPVITFSQSFPSGHAGNSMITFLALALFVAPERWRRTAVAAAVLLSLAMGSTRPMLGVHWPSDVLAGWIYGLTVVSLTWLLLHRRRKPA